MRIAVKKDGDGVWCCRPYLGTDALGRQIRPYRRFPSAQTREEAQELAEAWASHLTADGRVRSARLFDLLTDYIEMRERGGASPNTVKQWRLFTRNYVRRYLGTAVARDLTVTDLARFEQSLLKPKSDGGQGICRNSVIACHNFLRGAFNWLVDAGICEQNPMIYVRKPSPERVEAPSLDEADFSAVSRALAGAMAPEDEDEPSACRCVYALAAWLALVTGMRVGEVCAVRRRDVNRRRSFIHVGGNVIEGAGRPPWRREVTKGRRCRNVTVQESDIEVIDRALALEDRVLGPFGADDPIVTIDGRFMSPSTVSGKFSELRDRLGLPKRLTFHGLRHTHATWCLDAGVDLKTLSERLGHADEATTLRTYAHVLPGRDAAAAEAFGRAASAATDRFGDEARLRRPNSGGTRCAR